MSHAAAPARSSARWRVSGQIRRRTSSHATPPTATIGAQRYCQSWCVTASACSWSVTASSSAMKRKKPPSTNQGRRMEASRRPVRIDAVPAPMSTSDDHAAGGLPSPSRSNTPKPQPSRWNVPRSAISPMPTASTVTTRRCGCASAKRSARSTRSSPRAAAGAAEALYSLTVRASPLGSSRSLGRTLPVLLAQALRRPLREVAVAVVGQLARGLGRRHPAQLVDLVVDGELAVTGFHRPPADELLAVLVVAVGRLAQVRAEIAPKAGLLLDLAKRRLLEALSRVQLALRQRPVVVLRAVDERQLERVAGAAPDDSAGRVHVGVGHSAGPEVVERVGAPAAGPDVDAEAVNAVAQARRAHADAEAGAPLPEDHALVDARSHATQAACADPDARHERARATVLRDAADPDPQRAAASVVDVGAERLQPRLTREAEVAEPEQVLGASQERVVVVRRPVHRPRPDEPRYHDRRR